jgi:transposase
VTAPAGRECILLIVDRGPVHTAGETKEFVEKTGGKLRLFFLPSYSPELNPDEWVMGLEKREA